ncbi:MAG: NADH-quinone oxidoreductase subunit J [Pirellulales bacterium]|nr:NADH-quinone oxidoreductase subunit J [Pirellulales bacterium]
MNDPINWQSFFFLLFGLVACVFALAVVFSSNIVRMAFYLILSLGSTSGLFFLAGADFVGAMQLLIYVGGTLVLLVFGVMLTAQGPFVSLKTRGGEWVLASIVGGALFAVLAQRAVSISDWHGPERPLTLADSGEAASQPDSATSDAAGPADETKESEPFDPDGARAEENAAEDDKEPAPPTHEGRRVELRDTRTATAIGMALSGPRVDSLGEPSAVRRGGMSSYVLPFEIVSVHLLVVLIGAAYLARTKKRFKTED